MGSHRNLLINLSVAGVSAPFAQWQEQVAN